MDSAVETDMEGDGTVGVLLWAAAVPGTDDAWALLRQAWRSVSDAVKPAMQRALAVVPSCRCGW